MSWEGGKVGTADRWKGERYQKGGGRRVIPRFFLFVSGVNQKSDFLVWARG